MLHLVSFLGFLTVAVAGAMLIWSLIAERADAIVAALRMDIPTARALPAVAQRNRVRASVPVRGLAMPAAIRQRAA